MAAPIFGTLHTFFRMWPDDAVQTLIRRRRLYHPIFATTRQNEQTAYWTRISQDVMAAHPGLSVTADQCRNKWNSLRSGYENLVRLDNGNPEGFPTRTPSMHDERFFDELSDEFWLTGRK